MRHWLLVLLLATAAQAQLFGPTIPPRSKDQSGNYRLRYLCGDTLTADRALTFFVNDNNPAIHVFNDAVLDQDVSMAGNPVFASLQANGPFTIVGAGFSTDGASIGADGTFDFGSSGTVHGNLSLADDQSLLTSGATNVVWEHTPTDGDLGARKWSLRFGGAVANADGSFDHNFWLGNNLNATGTPANSSYESNAITLEDNYQVGPTNRQTEYYFQNYKRDGTESVRPFMAYVSRVGTTGVLVESGIVFTGKVSVLSQDAVNEYFQIGQYGTFFKQNPIIYNNNNFLYGYDVGLANQRKLIGIDDSNIVQVGSASVATTINGSSTTLSGTGTLASSASNFGLTTGGALTLGAGLTCTTGSITATAGNLTLTSGSATLTGTGTDASELLVSQTYTGSANAVTDALSASTLYQGTQASPQPRASTLSCLVSADPSTSLRSTGQFITYGKSTSQTFTNNVTRFHVGTRYACNANNTASNVSAGTDVMAAIYSPATTFSTNATKQVYSAVLGEDVMIASGKKLMLEGSVGSFTTPTAPTAGDSYLTLNTAGGTGSTNAIETYVDGSKKTFVDSAGLNVSGAMAATGAISGTTITGTGDATVNSGNVVIASAGKGLQIKATSNSTSAGANKAGTVTLSAGTATVSTTSVTASSIILLTYQSLGTITIPTSLAVTARTAGTSFVITSAGVTDTSLVGWVIIEPAP